jgi:hypothetical protein
MDYFAYTLPQAAVATLLRDPPMLRKQVRELMAPRPQKSMTNDVWPFLSLVSDNNNLWSPKHDWLQRVRMLSELVVLGYPRGFVDPVNLLPLSQSCQSATHLRLDYDDSPIFYIDRALFPAPLARPSTTCAAGSTVSRSRRFSPLRRCRRR